MSWAGPTMRHLLSIYLLLAAGRVDETEYFGRLRIKKG
jgi:hypothetical protein